MQNARLDESQAGIKISERNISNLRYMDDTTRMAGSEEELQSFLMAVKKARVKAGLKLNIQKTKIMTSVHGNQKGKSGSVTGFIFLGSRITADGNCTRKIKRLLLARKAITNLDSILKSRDITLLRKVHRLKATVFSSGHVWT